MTQKVIKIGTSIGIILSRETRKALKIKAGDMVEVKTHDMTRTATISPTKKMSADTHRVAELTYNFIQRYRRDLEALAKK